MDEHEQSGGRIIGGGADTCVISPYIPCAGFVPRPGVDYVSRLIAPDGGDIKSESYLHEYRGVIGTLIDRSLVSAFAARCTVETNDLIAQGHFAMGAGVHLGGSGCADAQDPIGRPRSVNLITPRYTGTLHSLNVGPPGAASQAIDSALVAAVALVRDGGGLFAHADLHANNAGYTRVNGRYIGCLADFGRILYIRTPTNIESIGAGIRRWAQNAIGVNPYADPAAVLAQWIGFGNRYRQCPLAVTRPLLRMWTAITQRQAIDSEPIQTGLAVVRGWSAFALTGQEQYLRCRTQVELINEIARERPGFVAFMNEFFPGGGIVASAGAPRRLGDLGPGQMDVIDDTAAISRIPGPAGPLFAVRPDQGPGAMDIADAPVVPAAAAAAQGWAAAAAAAERQRAAAAAAAAAAADADRQRVWAAAVQRQAQQQPPGMYVYRPPPPAPVAPVAPVAPAAAAQAEPLRAQRWPGAAAGAPPPPGFGEAPRGRRADPPAQMYGALNQRAAPAAAAQQGRPPRAPPAAAAAAAAPRGILETGVGNRRVRDAAPAAAPAAPAAAAAAGRLPALVDTGPSYWEAVPRGGFDLRKTWGKVARGGIPRQDADRLIANSLQDAERDPRGRERRANLASQARTVWNPVNLPNNGVFEAGDTRANVIAQEVERRAMGQGLTEEQQLDARYAAYAGLIRWEIGQLPRRELSSALASAAPSASRASASASAAPPVARAAAAAAPAAAAAAGRLPALVDTGPSYWEAAPLGQEDLRAAWGTVPMGGMPRQDADRLLANAVRSAREDPGGVQLRRNAYDQAYALWVPRNVPVNADRARGGLRARLLGEEARRRARAQGLTENQQADAQTNTWGAVIRWEYKHMKLGGGARKRTTRRKRRSS